MFLVLLFVIINNSLVTDPDARSRPIYNILTLSPKKVFAVIVNITVHKHGVTVFCVLLHLVTLAT